MRVDLDVGRAQVARGSEVNQQAVDTLGLELAGALRSLMIWRRPLDGAGR